MKVLLYGGTFDPPHNGHMNNLRAALALVQPDRALVMPAGTPPHKHASATPAELRLQMCACFTALSPAVQVSDWEIRRGGRSYTVHTLEWLRGQDPDGALYLCVGSDMLLTFQEWYRWQDMFRQQGLSEEEIGKLEQVLFRDEIWAWKLDTGAITVAQAIVEFREKGVPHPEEVTWFLEHIEERDKKKILVVGDSPSSDIAGAINSGLDSCLVNRKNQNIESGATYTISYITEIFEVLS